VGVVGVLRSRGKVGLALKWEDASVSPVRDHVHMNWQTRPHIPSAEDYSVVLPV